MKSSQKYTQDQKSSHVLAWRKSGLSKKTYCREQNIKYSTFRNWTIKGDLTQAKKFIPVTIKENNIFPETSTLQITYPNGVVITHSSDVDVATIVQLVKLY